jgi:chaperonin GroES
MALTSTTKITPLGDRVLVKPSTGEEVSAGGIVLPDTAREKPQEGTVVAVGNGRVLDDGTVVAMEVKTGDKVIYGKYSGTEIKIGDEDHLILTERDILGVLA